MLHICTFKPLYLSYIWPVYLLLIILFSWQWIYCTIWTSKHTLSKAVLINVFQIVHYLLHNIYISGLSTEATSNGFYIDTTPPLIKIKPYLSRDLGSMRDNSVVFRNTIRIRWEVEDEESFIQRQYLSIASHKGGEFNATSTEVCFRENGQIICFDTNKK